MASNQPRNPRDPQHGQAASVTSGSSSDCDAARYEVPLYPSEGSGMSSQEQAVTVSGLEYAVFMKGYRLIEKHYNHLPEYRGICQRFEDQARTARITWTSLSRPGQECSYLGALTELTDLLARMRLNVPEDRNEMREIVRLAHGVVNHRRTLEPLDQSHRLILEKWEHVRDYLQGIC